MKDLESLVKILPPKSLPMFYEEIAKAGKDRRVGIHINHSCLYFFNRNRIAVVEMEGLINALAPVIDAALAKEAK